MPENESQEEGGNSDKTFIFVVLAIILMGRSNSGEWIKMSVYHRRLRSLLMKYTDLQANHPELFDNTNALYKIITDTEVIKAWQDHRLRELAKVGNPKQWAEIGVVFDDPYILVLRDLVKFPDGKMGGYFRVINRANLKGGQGVAVLPRIGEKFLLLHIYRHPTHSWQYEVPRGFGEPGLPAADNARKEIMEETGGVIEELVDLGEVHSNSGLEGNATRLFYARLASTGEPEVAEGIEGFKWASLDELERMICEGEITDGFTIAVYTRAKLRGLI
jgi:ADP-ribose pyrophosphatase